jgi:hypothetical protein
MHVPRVIPSVTWWPRMHAQRLSLSRSSTGLSRSWYLAAIKPHRRALPRTGSGREGDCRSRTKQELTDQAV